MILISNIPVIHLMFTILAWTTSTVVTFQFCSVKSHRTLCSISKDRKWKSVHSPYTSKGTLQKPVTQKPITSTPSSTSSLYAFDVLSNINNFYQTAPYTAAFVTCGIKASAADLFAQTRTMNQEENAEQDAEEDGAFINESSKGLIDAIMNPFQGKEDRIEDAIASTSSTAATLEYQRNIAFILYGGLYQGMAQEYIYNHLFPAWFGMGNDLATALTKVAFDLTVISPFICIPIAYIVKAIIYRKDWWLDGIGKYVYDLRYKRLLLTYYSIWFPAGMCSFSLVPDHLRIAFIAFVSFFWLIILSTVSSSSEGENESNLLRKTEV